MAVEEEAKRGRRDSLWASVIDAINDPLSSKPIDSLSDSLERVFLTHIEMESESLDYYRDLHEHSPDPMVQTLMGEVVKDEEHHHGLFTRLAEQFAYELEPTGKAPALPTAPATPSQAAGKATIKMVKARARQERDGARRLRSLAKQNRDLHAGLFSLLLETMAMDSKKHEHILNFVAERMESAA